MDIRARSMSNALRGRKVCVRMLLRLNRGSRRDLGSRERCSRNTSTGYMRRPAARTGCRRAPSLTRRVEPLRAERMQTPCAESRPTIKDTGPILETFLLLVLGHALGAADAPAEGQKFAELG